MTDGEKRYALALGRHLRAVRESHGFTQGQAAQLYRQKTGKHGAGLVDLECGRSTVLTLLKLRAGTSFCASFTRVTAFSAQSRCHSCALISGMCVCS